MLQKFSKYLHKFVVLILLGMLVLSFSIWGVGDVFRGRVSDAVAVVGDHEISEGEFRKVLHQEINKLKLNFGDQLTDEVLKTLKVEKRVLAQLINDRLLGLAAADLGIIIGEKPVLKEIASVPQFRNEDGTFNSAAFKQFLYTQGQSEQGFISMVKQTMARQILTDSLTANPIVPSALLRAVYEHDNEQRKAEILIIPNDYISSVTEPKENELEDYYEKEKQKFATSEYRNISYIMLDKDTVNPQSELSDEALKNYYEEHKIDFTTPEKRMLSQMIFADKESADKAAGELKSGKEFSEVAKNLGQDESETNLGELAKEELLPEISDAVFSLEKGKISDPLESSLGWHIFKVTDVKPSSSKEFELVKGQIKDVLLVEKTDELIYSVSGKLEDEIAAGASLDEAAAKLGLSVKKIEGLSVDGKDKAGNAIPLPPYENFLRAAFSTDEGSDSGLQHSADDKTYFIIHVDSIAPSRIKALDEVKGLAISAWQRDKRAELLKDVGRMAEEKIRNKETKLAEVKTALASGTDELRKYKAEVKGNITTKDVGPIGRYPKPDSELPVSLLDELFAVGNGDSTGYHLTKDGSLVLARVTEVMPVKADDTAKLDETRTTFTYNFADDIWEQYLNYLPTKFPVKIFEERISERKE